MSTPKSIDFPNSRPGSRTSRASNSIDPDSLSSSPITARPSPLTNGLMVQSPLRVKSPRHDQDYPSKGEMTKDMLQERRRTFETLLKEETNYSQNLQVLIDLYLEPLTHMVAHKPLLSAKTIQDMFGNIKDLYSLSQELLTRLRDCDREPWRIGDVFVDLAPFFKAYSIYVLHCSDAVELVNSSLENLAFLEFWKSASQMPASKGQILQSLLVIPLQRIPRYLQQLQEMLENTDSTDASELQEAVTVLRRIADHITESRREHKSQLQLLNLSKMLITTDGAPPIHEGVRLLKQGLVMKRSRQGDYQPRALFLLSDRLLITSPTFQVDLPVPNQEMDTESVVSVDEDLLQDASIGNYTLHHNLELELVRANHEVVGEDLNDVGFQVLTSTKSFDAFCYSTQERNEWVETINIAAQERFDILQDLAKQEGDFLQANVLKRKLELASFQAPVWLPDDQAPECFICSKPFSTFVRRHHCRSCGRVVCFDCGAKQVDLPGINGPRRERVCDICYDHLAGRLNSRPSSFDGSVGDKSVDKSLQSSVQTSPKKDVASCQLCSRAFGWFVWKYQCKTCDKSVDYACFRTERDQCEPCSQGLDPKFIVVTTNGWSYVPE